MKTIKKIIRKIYFIRLVIVFLSFISITSNAQSIRNRIVDEVDSSKIIYIYTNIDTLAAKKIDCRTYGMVINAEGKNDYGLDYFIRAPKFMYINKTYRLKLFFEDGIFFEYGDINAPNYYDAGTEFEFRTIVFKNQMKKIQSTKLSFLRLERLGSYFDIPIEANYQNKLCNLAKFMLELDPTKE
jgi:hypothetical protein